MDPDANLQELRALAQELIDDGHKHEAEAVRLAELVEALDHWLTHGGFLPRPWQAGEGGRAG